MAEHDFNFTGGHELRKMCAAWFVSYSFYCYVDKTHTNWDKVSTNQYRISVFNRTGNYHKFWLQQILCMNDRRLNTNTIDLRAEEIKKMANILLKKY